MGSSSSRVSNSIVPASFPSLDDPDVSRLRHIPETNSIHRETTWNIPQLGPLCQPRVDHSGEYSHHRPIRAPKSIMKKKPEKRKVVFQTSVTEKSDVEEDSYDYPNSSFLNPLSEVNDSTQTSTTVLPSQINQEEWLNKRLELLQTMQRTLAELRQVDEAIKQTLVQPLYPTHTSRSEAIQRLLHGLTSAHQRDFQERNKIQTLRGTPMAFSSVFCLVLKENMPLYLSAPLVAFVSGVLSDMEPTSSMITLFDACKIEWKLIQLSLDPSEKAEYNCLHTGTAGIVFPEKTNDPYNQQNWPWYLFDQKNEDSIQCSCQNSFLPLYIDIYEKVELCKQIQQNGVTCIRNNRWFGLFSYLFTKQLDYPLGLQDTTMTIMDWREDLVSNPITSLIVPEEEEEEKEKEQDSDSLHEKSQTLYDTSPFTSSQDCSLQA